MTYKISFRKFAIKDVEDIIEWYGRIDTKLSADFLKELNASIYLIKKNPLQYSFFYKDYLKANTIRFPYKIIYKVNEDEIVILAIVHHKRYHRVWRSRK